MATINISTAQDWINLTKNGVVNGATYNITNNIDLSQYVVSSVNMASTDAITINGQGKTITISEVASDFTGLFASFNGGPGGINLLNVVYNSKLNITHTVDDVINFGFLVGNCWGGNISDTTVTVNDDVTINLSTTDQKINFGGFIGYFDNSVTGPDLTFANNYFTFEGNIDVLCKVSNPVALSEDYPDVANGCNVGGFIGCMNLVYQRESNYFNNGKVLGYGNLSVNSITNNSPVNIGGFCGCVFAGGPSPTGISPILNNIGLSCSNLNLTGNSSGLVNIGSAFGNLLFPIVNNSTVTITNNLTINGKNSGGLVGFAQLADGNAVYDLSLSVGNTASITGNNTGGIVGNNADYNFNNCNVLYGFNTILSGFVYVGTIAGTTSGNQIPDSFANCNVLFDVISFTQGETEKQGTTLVLIGDEETTLTATNYTNVFATTGNNATVPTEFTNNLTNIETVLNSDDNTKFLVPIVKAKYSADALTDDLVKTLFESSPDVSNQHKLNLLDTVLIHSNTPSVNVPFSYLKKGLNNFDSSVSDSAVIKHLNPAKKLYVNVDDKVYIAQNEGALYLNKLTRVPFSVDKQKGGAYFGRKFIKVGDDVNVNGFNFKLLGTGSLAVEVSEPSNLGWWFWVLIGILALLTVVLIYYLFIKPKPAMYVLIKDEDFKLL